MEYLLNSLKVLWIKPLNFDEISPVYTLANYLDLDKIIIYENLILLSKLSIEKKQSWINNICAQNHSELSLW